MSRAATWAVRCAAWILFAYFAGNVLHADVLWYWSFNTESGTLLTDGQAPQQGTAPAGTYNVIAFQVTSSRFAGNVGATYTEGSQPGSGFIWDGSKDTQWFRAGGHFTNGTNFYRSGTDFRYGFSPENYKLMNGDGDPYESSDYLLFVPGVCPPRTLHVDVRSPHCPGNGTPATPYCSLQDAIDASCYGGTILVAPGTYRENLTIDGQRLTIQSKGGAARTILASPGGGSVVTFVNGARGIFQGFFIRDGLAPRGGGIFCSDSAPWIFDCVIAYNRATIDGGAIYSQSSQPLVLHSTLVWNLAELKGGAMAADPASLAHIRNSIVWSNSSGSIEGPVSIAYSDVEDANPGLGNISADPQFLDEANHDYRLRCSSPCIDAATFFSHRPSIDFEGDPRIVDGDFRNGPQPDMGADELDVTWKLQATSETHGRFLVQAPPQHTGELGFVFFSLGDGSSGGIPLPGGQTLGLDAGPLFNLWASAPVTWRSAVVAGCPGRLTQQFRFIPQLSGRKLYYAGVAIYDLTTFVVTPTQAFRQP
ncbi:MAG: hypothetical protein RL885_28405 [Planctomycetota bacterium]